MSIYTYLFFGGNCAEALQTYVDLMGGTIDMLMKFSDAPEREELPEGIDDLVMHASVTIAGTPLMASDAPNDHDTPQGFAVSYQAKDIADAERVFAGLSEGGTVTMPLQETFWADRFGQVTDRFGTPWMINSEKSEG